MATQTETLLYEIIWDDGDAKKKADAWDKTLKDAQKSAKNLSGSFEDLIKKFGLLGAATIKFVEGADKVYQGFKGMSSYLKDFTNPAIAAFRVSVLAANVASTTFNKVLSSIASVGFAAFNAAISASVSLIKGAFTLALAGLKTAFNAVVGAIKATFNALKNLGGFLIDSMKNYALYENALSHARRTMNLSREETIELGKSLISLSSEMGDVGLKAGVSATELAKISGILGQLGFNVKDNAEQFEKLVVTVAKVGTAFGMSNQKAAEGLGILKNLYDLPVENIENAASSIAYLGNTTVATAGQIMDIMQRMGGIAGLLGVTAQEAAGLAATLREAGVSSQVSGTAMSQIFARLASDVDRFGEVLKSGGVSAEMLRMNIESGNATEALKMVLQGIQNINATEGKIAAIQALKDLGLSGVRVQQALLGLSNNLGGLNANLAASAEAFEKNTAINDAYNAAIDNSYAINQQFFTILDNIRKLIGEKLAITFSKFMKNYIIPFTTKIQEWLQQSGSLDTLFGEGGLLDRGLTAIGKALEKATPAIIKFLGSLDEKAISVVQTLIDKWKFFFEQNDEGLTGLDQFIAQISEKLKAWWTEHGPKIKKFLNDVLTIVANLPEQLKNADEFIKDIQDKIRMWKGDLEAVYDWFVDIGEAAGSFADKYLKDIKWAINATQGLVGKMIGLNKSMEQAEETSTGNSLFPDMVEWTDKSQAAVGSLSGSIGIMNAGLKEGTDILDAIGQNFQTMASQGQAIVEGAMAQTGQSLGMMGKFSDMSAAQLSQLKGSGVLGPSGLLAVDTAQRVNAGQQFRQDIASAQQARQDYAEQVLNVTLMMGDQEVGRINTALKQDDQQRQRRSFT